MGAECRDFFSESAVGDFLAGELEREGDVFGDGLRVHREGRESFFELAGQCRHLAGEGFDSFVAAFAEQVKNAGDLVDVAADACEQGERAGELADLAGDVLDGDAAVGEARGESFDEFHGFVDVGAELVVELVDERGELCAQGVDGGDGCVEQFAQ